MGGVLGKGDPVAWAAMADAMLKAGSYLRVTRCLEGARSEGNVRASLALCRDQMSAEREAKVAVEVCGRIAGPLAAELAVRAVRAVRVGRR